MCVCIFSLLPLFFLLIYLYFFFITIHFALFFFFFQAEDGIRDYKVTGVQTCALPIFVFTRTAMGLGIGMLVADRIRRPFRQATAITLVSIGALAAVPFLVKMAMERIRSEERRVGKECRSRWSPYH